jgi:beta-N-acetylhexosaminidase
VASPEQLRSLLASLQHAAAIPLLVAVDQEGGQVTRLKPRHGFPATLSARSLGERNDLELTGREADRMAAILAEMGINLNLAPVVDLLSNPDNPVIARLERSFAADPQAVAEQAAAVIAAHHRHGVLCAIKHFPGHGSSRDDSHLGVVDVSATWSERELEPFRLLLGQGLADAVMTAHLYNRRLDPRYPATLSAPTVDGLLRGRLGYQGVVISDDLQMGAIRSAYGWEQTVTAALAAGIDILLIGNNLDYEADIVPRTVALIQQLVADGKVSPQRIAASWRRIQALKARLRPAAPGVVQPPRPAP